MTRPWFLSRKITAPDSPYNATCGVTFVGIPLRSGCLASGIVWWSWVDVIKWKSISYKIRRWVWAATRIKQSLTMDTHFVLIFQQKGKEIVERNESSRKYAIINVIAKKEKHEMNGGLIGLSWSHAGL